MDTKQSKLILDKCECGEPIAYITRPNLYYYGICWKCSNKGRKEAALKHLESHKKWYWGQRHLRKYETQDKEYKDSEILILPTDYNVWFKYQLV